MYPPAKESDGGRLRGCGRSRWAPPTVCPPQRASSPIHGASRPPPPLPRATRRRGGVRAPAHATRPKAAVGPVGPGSAWASHRRHQRLHERGAPPAPSFPRASVPSTGCCQCRHRRARGMSSQRGGGAGCGRRPGVVLRGGCRQREQGGAVGGRGRGRGRGAGRPAARVRAQPAVRGRAAGGGREERGREPLDARPRRSRHPATACGRALALPLGDGQVRGGAPPPPGGPPPPYSSPMPLPAATSPPSTRTAAAEHTGGVGTAG